ncbi:Retrovirus-related Pol polyprotein from transposon 17.6 [Dictyocoela muelleri]|nr:Retrovirus-related Pol polyprotein from transposon 17.6 [Dictyocoela muelleri]
MQFTVMPQGFKNSPAIFQRGMNIILENFTGKICYCYIDDIIVFGRDKYEHKKNNNTVIKRLNEYKLIINKDKLVYCEEEVNFLGYRISLNKVKPLLDRTLGIKNFPIPTSKQKLRGFLSLINIDSNFIQNLSALLKPFYKLLQEDKFKWSDVNTDLFMKIQKLWSDQLELNLLEPGKKYVVETDASDHGLGAVLSQGDKPISYISRV